MTKIDINDVQVQTTIAKDKQLGQEWQQFAQSKNLDQQIAAWVQTNNVDQKLQNAGQSVGDFAKQLDAKNGITQWAQTNNVEQRSKDIMNGYVGSVSVNGKPISAGVQVQDPTMMTTININDAQA